MTAIADYHQAVKARLIADPLVARLIIQRERRTQEDGYLRGRLVLRNGDELGLSEYVQLARVGVRVITYSFHWADSAGRLVRRWDNAPHFSHLPGAPHHVHDGDETRVAPGAPVTLLQVLDEIAACLAG